MGGDNVRFAIEIKNDVYNTLRRARENSNAKSYTPFDLNPGAFWTGLLFTRPPESPAKEDYAQDSHTTIVALESTFTRLKDRSVHQLSEFAEVIRAVPRPLLSKKDTQAFDALHQRVMSTMFLKATQLGSLEDHRLYKENFHEFRAYQAFCTQNEKKPASQEKPKINHFDEKTESFDFEFIQDQFDEMERVLDKMDEAYTDTHIRGFETDPNIIKLYDELNALQARKEAGEANLNGDISQAALRLQSKKSEITAERENFTYKLQRTKQVVSGATQLLSVIDPELAQTIGTVWQSGFAIYENGASLFGAGILAGTVHPVLALGTIATAVGNIVNLFSNKKGADPHQATRRMIMSLSQQIDRWFEHQELRLNDLSHKMDKNLWSTLERFRALERSQLETHIYLNLIYFEIRNGFTDNNAKISEVIEKLNQLQTLLWNNSGDIDSLKETLRYIMTNNKLSFNEIANKLDHLGLEKSVTGQLKDLFNLPENAMPAHYFELSSYFATLINGVDTKSPNPILLSYATLANILLALIEHPLRNSAHPSERIATADITRLKNYAQLLETQERLFTTARSETVQAPLLSAYRQAAIDLVKQVQEKTKQLEAQYTQDKALVLSKEIMELRAEALRRFNRVFPLNLFDWFKGKVKHESRHHSGKSWSWTDSFRDYVHEADKWNVSGRQTYIQDREKHLENQREILRIEAEKIRVTAQNNQLSIFGTSRLAYSHGVPYILPAEDPTLPTLPAPTLLLAQNDPNAHIMKSLHEAQALGLGTIVLVYRIDVVEKKFLIDVKFKFFKEKAAESLSIVSLESEYAPSIYEGAEAVWNFWVGGTLVTQKEGTSVTKRDGITGAQAVNGGGSGHKNGEYDAYEYTFTVPAAPIVVEGKLIQLHANPNLNVTSFNTKNIESVRQQSAAASAQLKTDYRKDLQASLVLSQSDDLGKACIAFETAFHKLYGTLSFAYHETLQDVNSPLSVWFQNHASNLARLKASKLKQSPEAILNQLVKALPELNHAILEVHKCATQFDLVTDTKTALSQFLKLYTPFSVSVNKNRLSVSEMDEETRALAEFLTTLAGNLFENLPAEQAKQILNATTEKWMQNKGTQLKPEILDAIFVRLEAAWSQTSNPRVAGSQASFALPAAAKPVATPQAECKALVERADPTEADMVDLCSSLFGPPLAISSGRMQQLQAACAEQVGSVEAAASSNTASSSLFSRLCTMVFPVSSKPDSSTLPTVTPPRFWG